MMKIKTTLLGIATILIGINTFYLGRKIDRLEQRISILEDGQRGEAMHFSYIDQDHQSATIIIAELRGELDDLKFHRAKQ